MRGKLGLKLLLPEVPHQQIPQRERVFVVYMYILYFRMVWGFYISEIRMPLAIGVPISCYQAVAGII